MKKNLNFFFLNGRQISIILPLKKHFMHSCAVHDHAEDSYVANAHAVRPHAQAERHMFKGTLQREFLLPIFSQMYSSQALIYRYKYFSTLALNSRTSSRFFYYSPQLFLAESRYSSACFIWRKL